MVASAELIVADSYTSPLRALLLLVKVFKSKMIAVHRILFISTYLDTYGCDIHEDVSEILIIIFFNNRTGRREKERIVFIITHLFLVYFLLFTISNVCS